MSEWLTQLIGMIAATLTTLAFVPQVLRVLRTRDTASLSLPMYVMLCAGITLWLIYGLLLGSLPIILANAITLVLALVITTMKWRHG